MRCGGSLVQSPGRLIQNFTTSELLPTHWVASLWTIVADSMSGEFDALRQFTFFNSGVADVLLISAVIRIPEDDDILMCDY